MLGDETHAAHVGRQRVHFITPAGGLEATVPPAQIQQLKLIGACGTVFGDLEVDAADPISQALQVGDEMMADETTRACNCDAQLLLHAPNLLAPAPWRVSLHPLALPWAVAAQRPGRASRSWRPPRISGAAEVTNSRSPSDARSSGSDLTAGCS